MTTYADFQSYILRYLWRVGDAGLTSDLPRLISQAEARITRDIRDQEIEFEDTLPLTDNVAPLPSLFGMIRAVTVDGQPSASYCTPSQFPALQVANQNSPNNLLYTVVGLNLKLTGVAQTAVNVVYTPKIVPFSANPPDPFYDKYPDFYLAAVLIQCYGYMRDYEQAPVAEKAYADTLESMKMYAAEKRYAAPLTVVLPGVVM